MVFVAFLCYNTLIKLYISHIFFCSKNNLREGPQCLRQSHFRKNVGV